MATTTTAQQKRVVQDTKGSVYELREEMSRGGQGIVYRTQYPQALIKGFTKKMSKPVNSGIAISLG